DDISNLQSQIDKLATKEELQQKANELSSSISAAQSAADAAKKTAEDAAAAAKTATTGAEAAQKAAEAAQAAADKAQKAADAAQAAADKNAEDLKKAAEGAMKAVEEIQTAMKNLATKDEVTAAVKVVADKYDAQAKELKALSDRLDKVEAKLGLGEGGEDIDLTEIQKELDAIESDLKALVGVVSNMVTSVELVYNSQDKDYATNKFNDLSFKIVTEKKNDSFGKDKADKILTTTKDQTSFYNDEIYVRVNPVDAVLTKEDISLINSKGEELTGIVDVIDVQPYKTDAYITRAANQRTGLWAVKVAPAAGKKVADLWGKFTTDNYTWGATETPATNQIAYAVAVKSAISDSIASNRRVVSAYDVTMKVAPYTPTVSGITSHNDGNKNTIRVMTSTTNLWDVWHSIGVDINELHNRYQNTSKYGTNKELVWKNDVPQTAKKVDGVDYTEEGDSRINNTKNVVARVGENIEISFEQDIKGFYVMLDYDFVETTSQPSEINAWNSYKYENVGKTGVAAKMFEGNYGTIKVSELSGEATGDEIGFRIFAMNLDGTLLDPDGVAFYVTVGDSGADINLTAQTVTVNTPENSSNKFINGTAAMTFTKGTLKGATDVSWSYWSQETGWSDDDTRFAAKYRNTGNSNQWEVFNAANAEKYDAVVIYLSQPKEFKDNVTHAFTGAIKKETADGTEYTWKNMYANVTKKLPESAPEYVLNVGQTEEQIMKTSDDLTNTITWNGSAWVGQKNGILDFNDVFIQTAKDWNGRNMKINEDKKFIFGLANTAWDNDAKSYSKVLETPWNATTEYKATIPYSLINCSTPHAVSTTYNYGEISSENRPNGVGHNWIVNTTSKYSIKYMTWSYQATGYMQYAWLSKTFKDGNTSVTKTFDEVLNGDNFEIDLSRAVANPGNKISQELRKKDLKTYITDSWLVVRGASTEAEGITDPYYEYDSTTSGVLKMVRKAGVNNVPEHTATLKIKVQDCFGHVETISLTVKFVNDKPAYIWDATNGVMKLVNGNYVAL
ncbi:MAG: hypothetical protein ACI3Y0_06815, partial [Prevotella sp.]